VTFVYRTCFVCRKSKPLHRFGKAVGRFRLCANCRQMLECQELSDPGDSYIRQRMVERGLKPSDITAIIKVPKRSGWRILKDLLRGLPAEVK
jgi:hypothetical protein